MIYSVVLLIIDPMSPYLSILSLKALAQMMRDESQIKGLELPIGVVSLLLYIDDVTGLVADVESDKLFLPLLKLLDNTQD